MSGGESESCYPFLSYVDLGGRGESAKVDWGGVKDEGKGRGRGRGKRVNVGKPVLNIERGVIKVMVRGGEGSKCVNVG